MFKQISAAFGRFFRAVKARFTFIPKHFAGGLAVGLLLFAVFQFPWWASLPSSATLFLFYRETFQHAIGLGSVRHSFKGMRMAVIRAVTRGHSLVEWMVPAGAIWLLSLALSRIYGSL